MPKTLIYAKDDSHADDIGIVREEFGKGNDFCEKITYKTGTARIITKIIDANGKEVEQVAYKSTGIKPEDLLPAHYDDIVCDLDDHFGHRRIREFAPVVNEVYGESDWGSSRSLTELICRSSSGTSHVA